jgi:hypothetical protein
MSAASVRMMKEFRLLVWPWLAITTLAIIALYLQAYKLDWGPLNAQSLTALGFFAGMPLLAGLGLGSEFQYRTLGLTLAQPMERSEVWRSKNIAAIAAILLPAFLFCISGTTEFKQDFWLPILYVMIFTATAFPMTLIARSTIGGTALNALASCPVFWGAAWLIEYLRGHERLSAGAMIGITLLLIAYSVSMVWLGRRMFLKFQAAEGMQSVESILPGAGFVPAAIADWFRCRPSQMFLNLLRRELRLLRLIWPLSFL